MLAEMKASNLRGRGGAGFTTQIKWESARRAEGQGEHPDRYVVCNADEGEPGTALHRIVERHNRGELDDCPDLFTERLTAYRDAIAAAGIVVRRDLVERVAVLGRHRIAGTFDIGVEVGGRLYVADLKTGSGIDFGARGFAVQLAIYANAETLYDYRTDTHEDAPAFDTDRGLIIHLPSTGGPAAGAASAPAPRCR